MKKKKKMYFRVEYILLLCVCGFPPPRKCNSFPLVKMLNNFYAVPRRKTFRYCLFETFVSFPDSFSTSDTRYALRRNNWNFKHELVPEFRIFICFFHPRNFDSWPEETTAQTSCHKPGREDVVSGGEGNDCITILKYNSWLSR